MKWLEERPLVGLAIVVTLVLCGESIIGDRMDTRIESIALPIRGLADESNDFLP